MNYRIHLSPFKQVLPGLVIGFALAACGGGGSGGSSSGGGGPPPVTAPSGLSFVTPQSLHVNVAMTTIAPTVTGSVTSYSVTPALPTGLALSATTGQISGTPTVMTAPTTYTVTATNASGSATFGLSLKVFGVNVESASIARIAARGAPIYPQVLVRPMYFDVGTLHATATDASGLILPPVTVTANGDGSFSLRLSTNGSVSPNVFTGTANISLCRDAACATPQDVPSVSVPFAVRVMDSQTTWPGDNLKPLAASAGAPDWSTMQGNAAHTGFVPVTVNPDQFTLRWRVAGNQLWNPWNPLKPNLVTSNGLLYVVSSDYLAAGVVYARRELDGTEAWRFEVTGMSYPAANPAAVANGVVYFAAGHQTETYLFARNASDGTAVFRSDMTAQWEGYLSPTVGPNGMVYANAGTYGGLYAFNPVGNQLFFAAQSQVSNWTPAANATGIYAYTGGTLQVVDPLTGVAGVTIHDPNYQNYVSENGGAPVLGEPALGSVFGAAYTNSALNTGNLGNHLTNFRTTTGTIAWQIPGAYPTTPGYKNGSVYAANNIPLRLEARAEADGALSWSWTPEYTGDSRFVSEVLLTNNLAFVSTDHVTYAIDLTTHQAVWGYPASGKLALSTNGILYIHNNTDLIAVNLK